MTFPKLTPSIYFLLTLGMAVVLSWLFPWKISNYVQSETMRYLGIGILLTSFILNILAHRAFKKHLTPNAPFLIPQTLIQNGVFSLTRNPVYVALVLSQMGLACVFNTVWMLLTSVVLLGLLHFFIVQDEEKTLEENFAESYKEYREKTRRWL